MSARLFPQVRKFVETVKGENLDRSDEYVFSPWPADRINYFLVIWQAISLRKGQSELDPKAEPRARVQTFEVYSPAIAFVEGLCRTSNRLDDASALIM